jgi:transposase-like protein
MSEGPLCPLGDGRHKMRPWQGRGPERARSGFVCHRCHKTWEHTPSSGLVETYILRGWA